MHRIRSASLARDAVEKTTTPRRPCARHTRGDPRRTAAAATRLCRGRAQAAAAAAAAAAATAVSAAGRRSEQSCSRTHGGSGQLRTRARARRRRQSHGPLGPPVTAAGETPREPRQEHRHCTHTAARAVRAYACRPRFARAVRQVTSGSSSTVSFLVSPGRTSCV